jgi:hypothetical protein
MNLPERILQKRCFPRKRHIVRALVQDLRGRGIRGRPTGNSEACPISGLPTHPTGVPNVLWLNECLALKSAVKSESSGLSVIRARRARLDVEPRITSALPTCCYLFEFNASIRLTAERGDEVRRRGYPSKQKPPLGRRPGFFLCDRRWTANLRVE